MKFPIFNINYARHPPFLCVLIPYQHTTSMIDKKTHRINARNLLKNKVGANKRVIHVDYPIREARPGFAHPQILGALDCAVSYSNGIHAFVEEVGHFLLPFIHFNECVRVFFACNVDRYQ